MKPKETYIMFLIQAQKSAASATPKQPGPCIGRNRAWLRQRLQR